MPWDLCVVTRPATAFSWETTWKKADGRGRMRKFGPQTFGMRTTTIGGRSSCTWCCSHYLISAALHSSTVRAWLNIRFRLPAVRWTAVSPAHRAFNAILSSPCLPRLPAWRDFAFLSVPAARSIPNWRALYFYLARRHLRCLLFTHSAGHFTRSRSTAALHFHSVWTATCTLDYAPRRCYHLTASTALHLRTGTAMPAACSALAVISCVLRASPSGRQRYHFMAVARSSTRPALLRYLVVLRTRHSRKTRHAYSTTHTLPCFTAPHWPCALAGWAFTTYLPAYTTTTAPPLCGILHTHHRCRLRLVV